MRTLLNGSKEIDRKDFHADKYQDIVVGENLPEKDMIYVFDSEDEFTQWREKTDVEESFSAGFKLINEVQKSEQKDTTYAMQRQLIIKDRMIADLYLLASKLGLDINSPELFRRATSEPELLEGSIFDTGIAWEHGAFHGSYLPYTTVPMPALFLFGWEDRISSIRHVGVTLATARRWFRGVRLWLTAGLEIPDLTVFNFNDRIASIVNVP
jgi:hypothetical protein